MVPEDVWVEGRSEEDAIAANLFEEFVREWEAEMLGDVVGAEDGMQTPPRRSPSMERESLAGWKENGMQPVLVMGEAAKRLTPTKLRFEEQVCEGGPRDCASAGLHEMQGHLLVLGKPATPTKSLLEEQVYVFTGGRTSDRASHRVDSKATEGWWRKQIERLEREVKEL